MREYPWYELISNSELITQGDILHNCQVPVLGVSETIEENSTVAASVSIIDGVILTQACDIENRKIKNIILCSILTKEEFESQQRNQGRSEKQIKKNIESIIKGQQPALHILNKFENENYTQDYIIVDFKDLFSVPVSYAQSIAKNNKKRLRLCPPYREHLSQAFARYFMRVGLPIDIRID
ncbi:MAG: hypothetical protein IJP92_14610 [Lachnospiraceae bacterium]|nr:hypothetical protein [Lachnospiraceae bacterium]